MSPVVRQRTRTWRERGADEMAAAGMLRLLRDAL
jgi:hypothetical protein